MNTVTVSQNPPGKVKQLDALQVAEFCQELRRVRIFWWITWTRGRPQITASPEVKIELNRNGKISSYELYGGQILYEINTGRRFQFYMGHLLTFWLFT
jgi:hypothetical protein